MHDELISEATQWIHSRDDESRSAHAIIADLVQALASNRLRRTA